MSPKRPVVRDTVYSATCPDATYADTFWFTKQVDEITFDCVFANGTRTRRFLTTDLSKDAASPGAQTTATSGGGSVTVTSLGDVIKAGRVGERDFRYYYNDTGVYALASGGMVVGQDEIDANRALKEWTLPAGEAVARIKAWPATEFLGFRKLEVETATVGKDGSVKRGLPWIPIVGGAVAVGLAADRVAVTHHHQATSPMSRTTRTVGNANGFDRAGARVSISCPDGRYADQFYVRGSASAVLDLAFSCTSDEPAGGPAPQVKFLREDLSKLTLSPGVRAGTPGTTDFRAYASGEGVEAVQAGGVLAGRPIQGTSTLYAIPDTHGVVGISAAFGPGTGAPIVALEITSAPIPGRVPADSGLSTGAIVGIAVGGAAALILLVAAVVVFRRRGAKAKEYATVA
ncbi:hypothetical protein H9P43_006542 [Blastocladiella emersonii ATCC 22665]|nr:hypothetical protein H9P43_006542 [Blastocladiella emersonii ATCC 22665]